MDEQQRASLKSIFRRYAETDFPSANAFFYAPIACDVADDDDLIDFVAERRPGQPAPNLLFAAVHYLLLSGVEHPLRAYYPDLTAEPLPAADAFPQFRDFCMTHRDDVRAIVASRLVQTNVLERCTCLLPAFATAAKTLGGGEGLAMIEIGASAGFNLLWDRYRYEYGVAGSWGDAPSTVQLNCEVRGDVPLPALPADLETAWSTGIDLDPVDIDDDDAVLWQRALIWPDRVDRRERMDAAIAIARAHPVRILEGDALELLPAVIAEAPMELPLVIAASFTLYQFSREARAGIDVIIGAAARSRPMALVTMDVDRGTGGDAVIDITLFGGGEARPRRLARSHPHGAWIEWLGEA